MFFIIIAIHKIKTMSVQIPKITQDSIKYWEPLPNIVAVKIRIEAAVGKYLKISGPAENSKGLMAPELNQRVKLTKIVGAGINRKSPIFIPYTTPKKLNEKDRQINIPQ